MTYNQNRKIFFQSLGYTLLFYVGLFLSISLILLLISHINNLGLLIVSIFVVLIGNLCIILTNHLLHWIVSFGEEDFKDFIYEDFGDCFIRCFSGLLEMSFYTIAFAIRLEVLVIGYLAFKVLAYWQPDKDNNKKSKKYSNNKRKGLSKAILRSTSIFQFIFSFIAAYFLFQFFRSFPDFFNLINGFFIFK